MKKSLLLLLSALLLIGAMMLLSSCDIFSIGGPVNPTPPPSPEPEPDPSPDPAPTVEYVTVTLVERIGSEDKTVGTVEVVKGTAPSAENIEAIKNTAFRGYIYKSWHTSVLFQTSTVFDTKTVLEEDITLWGNRGDLAGKSITWSYNDETNTLSFVGTGEMFDFQYNSDPAWIRYANLCENVSLDDRITSIGNHAFFKFDKISTVRLPSSTVRIGERAFYETSIEDINFPNTVKTIGVSAFHRCNNLTELVFNPGLNYIGEQAFYQCNGVTRVTLTDKIAEIGNSAFYECKNIKTAYYFGTREEYNNLIIRLDNFWVKELANTYFFSSTKPSEPGPYWYYTDSGEILPWYYTVGFKAPNTIVPFAWDYVDPELGVQQRNIDFMNSIVYHGYKFASFSGREYGVTAYEVGTQLPGDIHLLGNRGRLCGDNLTYKKSGTTLTIMGTGAMWDFEGIKDAPWYGANITKVVIESGVTYLGKNFLCDIEEIVSIDIPTNITAINKNAFFGCDNLLYIYYLGTKSELDLVAGASELEYLVDANVYANNPDGSGEGSFWRNVTGGMETVSRRVAWSFKDGVLSVGGDATLVNYLDVSETPWYPDRAEIRKVEIIRGANRVGYNSFNGMTSVVDIVIPSSVRKIAASAFFGTGYYNDKNNWSGPALYISSHLIKVDPAAVGESFTVNEGTLSIAEDAFDGCTSIKSLIFSKDTLGIFQAALEPLELDAIYFTGHKELWEGIWGEGNGNNGASQDIDGVPVYFYSYTEPKEEGLFWRKDGESIYVWPAFVPAPSA